MIVRSGTLNWIRLPILWLPLHCGRPTLAHSCYLGFSLSPTDCLTLHLSYVQPSYGSSGCFRKPILNIWQKATFKARCRCCVHWFFLSPSCSALLCYVNLCIVWMTCVLYSKLSIMNTNMLTTFNSSYCCHRIPVPTHFIPSPDPTSVARSQPSNH